MKKSLLLLTTAFILAACGTEPGSSVNPTPNPNPTPSPNPTPGPNPTPSPNPNPKDPTNVPTPPPIIERPGDCGKDSFSTMHAHNVIIPQAKGLHVQALPSNAQTKKVALRVLLLTSGSSDFGTETARRILEKSGVPYDVFDATSRNLRWNTLVRNDGVGRYQGVMLTSNALTVNKGGKYVSAMTDNEWTTLFKYEKAFKVRQLAMFGSAIQKPEDYGVRKSAANKLNADLQLTADGKKVFNDLTGAPVPVRCAFMYPAKLEKVPNIQSQALLKDKSGNVLAVTSQTNGRERMLMLGAQNYNLRHTQLLGYGMVKWLTKGVHLGEHRRFLQIDIDDWFAEGDHYDPDTNDIRKRPFRLSAKDALNLPSQQDSIRKGYPLAKDFIYAMFYNGGESVIDAPKDCSLIDSDTASALTSATKCLTQDFDWVNHTTNHHRMDVMSYKNAVIQVKDNDDIGVKLGFKMSRKSLVTGEHSGLGFMDPNDDGTRNDKEIPKNKQDLGLERTNLNLLAASKLTGIRYIGSNHSVPSQRNKNCFKCGIIHPLDNDIVLIPRWPNQVAYHVATPREAVGFYNSLFGPGGKVPYWKRNLSYEEYLNVDTEDAFGRILDGAPFPHFMHQPNLDQYAPNKSLATDWVRALVNRYSAYTYLPLNTMLWDDLGVYVERMTREEEAKRVGKLTGVWDRSNQVVTLNSSANIPYTLTGSATGKAYHRYLIESGDISGSKTFVVAPQ